MKRVVEMSTSKQKPTQESKKRDHETFAEGLKVLMRPDKRGDLAVLKRAAGYTIGEAPDAAKVFYRLLPYSVREQNEDVYFLVATLYGLNQYERLDHENFGKTLRDVKARTGSDSIDKRFLALLDSPGDAELAYRLRQCIKLAASQLAGVDWARLIKDLLYWNTEDKTVQKDWARSYFKNQEE